MRRHSQTSQPVELPSPSTWAALADYALAMGHQDQALALIEEAFAACDRTKHYLELGEAA